MEDKAASSGMDPALIQGVISMLTGGAGAAGGASGGSGFNLGSLIQGKDSQVIFPVNVGNHSLATMFC